MPVATSHWNVVSASTLRSFTHHFYFRYFNDLFLSSTFAANFMVVCCGIRSAVEDVCIAWRNYSATISACLWSVGTATCKKKLSWLVAALDLWTKKNIFFVRCVTKQCIHLLIGMLSIVLPCLVPFFLSPRPPKSTGFTQSLMALSFCLSVCSFAKWHIHV